MKTTSFTTTVNAPAEKVHATMISKEGFSAWMSVFRPDSYYKGSWGVGEKVTYFSPRKDGSEASLVCTIKENRPGEVLHIQPVGLIHEGEEVTSGDMVAGMNQTYDLYTFAEKDGVTTIHIEISFYDDLIPFFEEKWPVALEKIKEMSEAD